MVACLVSVNVYLFSLQKSTSGRPYMVEIFRVTEQIKNNQATDLDTLAKDCTYIKQITLCNDQSDLIKAGKYDYCIREINGNTYRFDYDAQNTGNHIFIVSNIILMGSFLFIIIVLLYIEKKIIKPFHNMEQIPYELSKGNLALELPEEHTKFFGRFIWGTNLLRENIEERRQKELNMHRDKKLLLLSLTHDIKTPLSVIKLNAQALSKNLYKDEERKQQAAITINEKVNEIEKYVTEIIAASREEFLELSVKDEEFYLSSVIHKIEEHYKNKLGLHKTELDVKEYSDYLLQGDENRLLEVLQNLMENAIKYGDGQRITISFSKEEECCLISVANTGAGMSQDEITKVFDSFYRGSNVSDKPGNGLGLYICRQLMTNMNGDIFVKQTEQEFVVTVVVRMS